MGESLREAAVLFLVFGLLEKLLDDRLRLSWAAGIAMISFGVLILGILVERRRRS